MFYYADCIPHGGYEFNECLGKKFGCFVEKLKQDYVF